MSSPSVTDSETKIIVEEEICALPDSSESVLSYEVLRSDDLYIYRFSVSRGGQRTKFIEFTSSEIHEELIRSLVEIVKRATLSTFRVTYLSDSTVDLKDFIESIGLHDEAGAFVLLLKINDEGLSLSPEERDQRARDHVKKWEGKSLSKIQKCQYFYPALDQWGVDTFKSLYFCGTGRADAVRNCHDPEFRRLYNFLSVFAARSYPAEDADYTLGEVLERLPDRDNYFLEERSVVSRFPIHSAPFRDFLMTLTMEDLEYLNSASFYRAFSVQGAMYRAFSAQGAIRIARYHLDYFHSRQARWWPTPPVLSSLIDEFPEVKEIVFRQGSSRLAFEACVVSSLVAQAFREFIQTGEKSPEEAHSVFFGSEGLANAVGGDDFCRIYVIESLLETVGSSPVVFDILKSASQGELPFTVEVWEEYIFNWESFRGMDPLMTLNVLAGGSR